MQTMGLSTTQRRIFEDQLRTSHAVRITVDILDSDEKQIGSLSTPQSSVLSGDVQMDNTAETKRTLSISIMDPDQKLALSPQSPADQAVFIDNFVSVKYGVWVVDLGEWVDVPIFWGPIKSLSRDDNNAVSIEAWGKEYLMKKPHLLWKSARFPKGKKTVDTLRAVMQIRGETRFGGLPDKANRKLPKPLSISRNQEAWKICKKLAQSMNMQLFYDGDGQVRLRPFPATSIFLFDATRGIAQSLVQSEAKLTFDTDKFRNTVEVKGHKNDQKKQVHAVAYAPRNHPLSPWSLARDGKPRYLVESISNDHVKRLQQAKALAVRKLRSLLRAHVDVEFESLVVPHLEEMDIVALKTSEYNVDFELTQMTIPLTEQDTMSVGFNKMTKKIPKKGIVLRPKKRAKG